MRATTIIVSAALVCQVLALPNALPTYSVVDVDGGANGHSDGHPVPTTVYKTVTEAASKVTVTVTATAVPSTFASMTTTTLTESVTVTVYSEHSVSIPSTTTIATTTTAVPHATWTPVSLPVAPTNSAAVSVPSSPSGSVPASSASSSSTATYDDGLWHASYAAKPVETASQSVGAYEPTHDAPSSTDIPSWSSARPVATSSGAVYRRQAKRARLIL